MYVCIYIAEANNTTWHYVSWELNHISVSHSPIPTGAAKRPRVSEVSVHPHTNLTSGLLCGCSIRVQSLHNSHKWVIQRSYRNRSSCCDLFYNVFAGLTTNAILWHYPMNHRRRSLTLSFTILQRHSTITQDEIKLQHDAATACILTETCPSVCEIQPPSW